MKARVGVELSDPLKPSGRSKAGLLMFPLLMPPGKKRRFVAQQSLFLAGAGL